MVKKIRHINLRLCRTASAVRLSLARVAYTGRLRVFCPLDCLINSEYLHMFASGPVDPGS
jgi:hypothetical protein